MNELKVTERSSAYELADNLAFTHIDGDDSGAFRCDLQDMLRQQADRIAELEKGSEPVAWMDKYGNICLDIDKKMNQGKITALRNYHANNIPLYTTPQTKPLSDEEILDLFQSSINWDREAIEFARAIEERVLGK